MESAGEVGCGVKLRDSPGSSSSRVGFDNHLLVAARRALTLPTVELRTESQRGGDLFDLLSPRLGHIQFVTHTVITEVRVGFGSKEIHNLLRISD